VAVKLQTWHLWEEYSIQPLHLGALDNLCPWYCHRNKGHEGEGRSVILFIYLLFTVVENCRNFAWCVKSSLWQICHASRTLYFVSYPAYSQCYDSDVIGIAEYVFPLCVPTLTGLCGPTSGIAGESYHNLEYVLLTVQSYQRKIASFVLGLKSS
jgi:hypothetical protein